MAGAGTRGAAGRAKLQSELALQKGLFFQSVLCQMARRMQPTMPASGTPQELLLRGVSGTQYFERYGGYGRHRELGTLAFQVMTIMDFLQAENWPAAKDATALLSVVLDQACLDNGRFELANQWGPCPEQRPSPPGRPKVGDSSLGLLEGVRYHHSQAHGVGRGVKAESLRNRLKRRPSKTKTSAQKDREGQGQRQPCFKNRDRGGRLGSTGDIRFMHAAQAGLESNPLCSSISLRRWMACLPRWILKTRAKFAWCLRLSFSAVRRSQETSTSVFPLPLASLDCFRSSGPGLSSSKWFSVCRSRLLNIWILALDFPYLSRWPTLDELRRIPSKRQLAVFEHLRRSLTVCGCPQEDFPLCPGRTGPELGASLFQLEQFCESSPIFDSGYMKKKSLPFRERPEVISPEKFPELVPYRSLCADRLKLVGEGRWPMADYLDGVLWLPFQEPTFLHRGLDLHDGILPTFSTEDPVECEKLALLWDARGLLSIFDGPAKPGLYSRVLNCYKNTSCDRQIGDRRIYPKFGGVPH